ncbi:MAG: hypothetical protein IPK15_26045 [Verrucomicrobia bacterium]|nr:hypothetical protein [Verrucomicrobiota bacterium]
MKFIGKHLPLIGILLLTIFVGAAAGLYFDVPARLQNATKKVSASQPYTCPMHPEVVSHKPGSCPKCGMALTVASGDKNTNPHAGCGVPEHAAPEQPHGCCPKPDATKLTLPPGHPPIDTPQAHAGCGAAAETASSPATPAK